MKAILALDQGTTSSRALLFDGEGVVRGVAQEEFRQYYPEPGWVEHDGEEIWASQRDVVLQALAESGLSRNDLVAVGITNQRETTRMWDRGTGRAIAKGIVWQDRRTADFCSRLKGEGLEKLFRERTGLLLDPYFSGTKIRWILDHVEGAQARAERGELAFGTVDSWLAWKLTGGQKHITDATNASRTLIFNIHTGDWDDDLLEILGIPRSLLPTVCASSEVYGQIEGMEELRGVPLAGIAGDQQAALFGQACFQPGMAKNTYGTGCFLLMNTGEKPVVSENGLLSTVAWKFGERIEYALEGSVFIGGAVVQWLRDELGILKSAAEVEGLAGKVPDNGGVFLVPAFSGLGAPHWDPYARGAIMGLTRGSSAAHLARAALESIAFQSCDVLRAMERDAGIQLGEVRVDGGASSNNFLMQFQADLLGVSVTRPRLTETTAVGAACLAGLAVGFWKSREEIAGRWRTDRTFQPERPGGEMEALRQGWERALERAKGWVAVDEKAGV